MIKYIFFDNSNHLVKNYNFKCIGNKKKESPCGNSSLVQIDKVISTDIIIFI